MSWLPGILLPLVAFLSSLFGHTAPHAPIIPRTTSPIAESSAPHSSRGAVVCVRSYRNDTFGFEFRYPVCDGDQWNFILLPVEIKFGEPWLFGMSFCNERNEIGSCGMGNTEPDFGIRKFNGEIYYSPCLRSYLAILSPPRLPYS